MKQKLGELLIALLRSGPLKKADLIRAAADKTKATSQATYKALRLLRDKEIITMQRKTVSLSLIWLDDQLNTFKQAIEEYLTKARIETFLGLRPGGSVTFKFRTLRELDIFWVHTFLLTESQIPSDVPMYAIIPHDWFSYVRPSTDRVWARRLSGGRHQGIVVTHALPFDKRVSQERMAKGLEFMFNKNPLKLDERTYINVIHHWVFQATLDEKVNEFLVAWMRNHQEAAKNDRRQLDLLCDLPGAYRLKITHSSRLAEKLTKKIAKYFTFTLAK